MSTMNNQPNNKPKVSNEYDDEKGSKSLYTTLARNTQHKHDILKIKVKTNQFYDPGFPNEPRFKDSFVIYGLYSDQEKIENLFEQIRKHFNIKYHPITVYIHPINDESFTGGTTWDQSWEIDTIAEQVITDYDREDIINEGLDVDVSFSYYEHKIKDLSISCKYMLDKQSKDPLQCPIYYATKEKYDFSDDNLKHLKRFVHFQNECKSKPKCKYASDCNAFKRLENGGNRLDDKTHLILYGHPPRSRNIKLAQNINPFIMNTEYKQNEKVYTPTDDDRKKYGWIEQFYEGTPDEVHNGSHEEDFKKNGSLKPLIEEVIVNGFKSDLCFKCGVNDDCKHIPLKWHYKDIDLLKVVDDKINDARHKQMGSPLNRGKMLALVLYTGCECNYDLCSSQRNGEYKKWQWFDYCLYNAINELSVREKGDFAVYSGLNGVKLNKKKINKGWFKTYVSSSWIKEVATSFMGNDQGMIFQIDKKFKKDGYIKCCDVSWISKFPDEKEVLFARSRLWGDGD
eukprot:95277_1